MRCFNTRYLATSSFTAPNFTSTAAAATTNNYLPSIPWKLEPFLWPALGCGLALGGAELGASLDLLHSASVVGDGGCFVAAATLLPMGLARGACSGVQEQLHATQVVAHAVRATLEPALAALPADNTEAALDQLRALAALARSGEATISGANAASADFLQARGLRGMALRLAFATVLPRQDVILEYALRELQMPGVAAAFAASVNDVLKIQVDVAARAANGFATSCLVNWRRKATLV
jgi:hypothetical protein